MLSVLSGCLKMEVFVGIEHATIGIWVLMFFLIGPVVIYIKRAKLGRALYVRRIPGINAVEEGIARAAELGRPISFTTGTTGIGPVLYACLGVLFYLGRKAGIYKTRLFAPQSDPQVMAVTEDVLRDAYRTENKLDQFDPKKITFLSDDQFAFAAGYMGLVHREQVASAFMFGSFAAESLILAEAGRQIGAMQIAASVSPEQVAFFICTCDYTLIGEELFAASAYLTEEPIQLGSLYGQDRAKLILLMLILLGVVIATLNSVLSLNLPNIDYFITYKTSWL